MMAMTKLLPLAALLLAACATTSAATPREGPVALGETAYVGGPTVKPVKVIEDSRCPENARCIWAGRIVVRSIVTTGKGKQTLDLTLGKRVPVADGTLALVSALPEKSAKVPTKPSDYRFAFEFQGGL